MKLITERLELVPLTVEQVNLWLDDLPALERELGCSYQAEPIEGVFRQIVAGQLAAVLSDPEGYLWHGFWFIIRQSDRVAVGSADFKTRPDERGEVEIGYGLGAAFEHMGYMTEAVAAMCGWALAQPGVRHVIAETDLDGCASQAVLRRCGFSEYRRSETVWWRR